MTRAIMALVLLAAMPVLAQTFDSRAPVDIDAARMDLSDDDREVIFSGAVVIRQANLTLNADRVRVTYAKDAQGNPQVQRLDALGNVRIAQDRMKATARTGYYDVESRLITLVGAVKMDRDGNLLEGERVVWNLNTRRSSLDARTASNPGGRVTARLKVPEKKN